jgi:hypothetical protein
MGCQRLGVRWVRRLARITGENVIAGWGHGGYVHGFVTADHRHGWHDLKDGTWGFDDPDDQMHYSSCNDRWPGFREGK